ncbi:MAG: rRNA maturation RNase YbeY [Chloroflexia bacterium]|nr:rRNA maturation RNase YbeY [Chloroflexia bacterium]
MAGVFRHPFARHWLATRVGELALSLSLDVLAPIPDRLTGSTLESLLSFVLRAEGAGDDWVLAFRFTSDEDIRTLHLQFMDLDSPTDILTFPYAGPDDAPFGLPENERAGGDIVISVERAATQAAEARWSLFDELLFLSIHGTLHLLGWDDRDTRSRDAMLGRQEALLGEWKASPVPL